MLFSPSKKDLFLRGRILTSENPINDVLRRVVLNRQSPLTSIDVKSLPDGAEITVDDKFMGNTPSTLRLVAGDHKVKLQKPGFKPWERTLTVVSGGTANVNATLEQ
jgi:hypothetical protein